MIDGMSVTSIGDDAFSDQYLITSVTIPDSVITIGERAFSYCIFLTSVIIGNCVNTIGAGAFSECSNLTTVVVPRNVTSIEDGAFSFCTSLTSIIFEGNAPTVGSDWLYKADLTIYYYEGAVGFDGPEWEDLCLKQISSSEDSIDENMIGIMVAAIVIIAILALMVAVLRFEM
jgi:hypothetical protein